MPTVDLRKIRFALELAQRKAFMFGVEDADVGDDQSYSDVLADALRELDKFNADEVEASLPEDFEHEPC